MQNGVQEADSPIKKVAKRSRQILDSDDEEAPAVKEQAATKGQADKDVPGKTEKVTETFYFLSTTSSVRQLQLVFYVKTDWRFDGTSLCETAKQTCFV